MRGIKLRAKPRSKISHFDETHPHPMRGVFFYLGYAKTPLPDLCVPSCLVVSGPKCGSSSSYEPGNLTGCSNNHPSNRQ